MRFYWFADREYRLLQLCDGRTTLPEMVRRWQRRQPQEPLTVEDVRALLARLHACSLLHSVPALAPRPPQRRRHRRVRRLLAPLANPLAVRLPLFDPTPILRRLDMLRPWLFHRRTLVGLALFIAFTAAIACSTLATRVVTEPFFDRIFAADSLVYFVIAFVVLKSCHELGHALTCRQVGGECHEVGIFFLVLIPCLYCDVSDIWKQPSRRARVAVSAAGIVVELTFAAIAAWVWMAIHPSTIHSLAMAIMLTGSINSLLVNGNPLLRFDGYYILADAWDVPNLAEQARQQLQRWFQTLFYREPPVSTKLDARPWLLGGYAIASVFYRVALLGVIALSLQRWLRPLDLQWLLLFFFGGMMVLAGIQGQRSVRTLLRHRHQLRGGAALLTVAAVGVAVAVFVYVPWPFTVSSRGLAQRSPRQFLYVPADATIESLRRIGDPVQASAAIGQLRSFGLQMETLRTSGEVRVLRQRLADAADRRIDDPNATNEFAATEETLARTEAKLSELQRQVDRLQLTAEQAGVLLSGDPAAGRYLTSDRDGRLKRGWREISLRQRHAAGVSYRRGSTLAMVGSATDWQARLFVHEDAIPKLSLGATATVILDRDPSRPRTGKVQAIATQPITRTPATLQNDPGLPSTPARDGPPQPYAPHYAVTIQLDQPAACPSHLALLTGHIEAAPQTLASRLRNYILGLLRR